MNESLKISKKNNPTTLVQPDRTYVTAFYCCVGFAPAVVTLVADRAMQITFVIISLITIVVLFISKPRIEKFLLTVVKPKYLILLLFGLYLLGYSIFQIWDNHEQLRILTKPFVVFLAVVVLGFLSTRSIEINVNRLGLYLSIGILISLVLMVCLALFASLFHPGKFHVVENWYSFFHVHKLNRELEILAIFSFLAPVFVKSNSRTVLLTTLVVIAIWGFSFYSAGSLAGKKDIYFAYHASSETVQIALPIALIVFFLAIRFPEQLNKLVFLIIAILLMFSPWLFKLIYLIVNEVYIGEFIIDRGRLLTVLVRIEVWNDVANKVLETPIFGSGIDSARYLNHVDLTNEYYKNSWLWHPHNMFLQIWLDIGIFGVALVTALLFFSWKAVSKLDRVKQPSVLASLTVLSMYGAATHSVWQTWSMSLIATVATFITAMICFWPSEDLRAEQKTNRS